jgi:hypothetical protein
MIKTIIAITAITLGCGAVQAQPDTTKKFKTDTTTHKAESTKGRGVIRISASDIPAALRATLQAPEYSGWENASLYRSPSGLIYTVVFRNGTQTKRYRFDKDGKPLL